MLLVTALVATEPRFSSGDLEPMNEPSRRAASVYPAGGSWCSAAARGGCWGGSLLPPPFPQVLCLRFPAAPWPALPAQLPGAENDSGHPSALAGTVMPTSESPASGCLFRSPRSASAPLSIADWIRFVSKRAAFVFRTSARMPRAEPLGAAAGFRAGSEQPSFPSVGAPCRLHMARGDGLGWTYSLRLPIPYGMSLRKQR